MSDLLHHPASSPGGAAQSKSRPAKLRVRTRKGYVLPFVIDLQQRNAALLRRPWTPLARLLYWADAFALLPDPDYDLVHSFNAVPIAAGGRPYLISFEDFCPRVPEDRYVGWLERRLQRELTHDRCVALLAISEYAARQFRHQNRDFSGLQSLEAKLEVLYPAVALRRSEPKQMDGRILKLLFVGRDFMRKGGSAVLRAHELLRERGVPVQSTIVSSLGWKANDSYVDPPSPELVQREVARLDGDGIVLHRSLPNSEVFELMEQADFFVFPTLHDTFGFVVLEALACGTPVLASATNALPEMVSDGQCGYLLPLELDEQLGRWSWTYRTHEAEFVGAYEAATRALAESLADRLSECFEARETYGSLSEGALERVRTRFDADAARERLEALYERCRGQVPGWRKRLGAAEARWLHSTSS